MLKLFCHQETSDSEGTFTLIVLAGIISPINLTIELRKPNKTTIQVSRENYKELQKWAYVGEDFDTALGRALKSAKAKEKPE